MTKSVNVEIPVLVLFRVPEGIEVADIAEAVENMFEHGSIRDSFQECASQLATRATAGMEPDSPEAEAMYNAFEYDGYVVEYPDA